MTVAAKSAELAKPNGSHYLSTDYPAGPRTPFSKEELFPVVQVDLPRVGVVLAKFSADRYVASSYDEKTGESSPVWTDWRIYAREIDPSHGVGDAARAAINEAGRPLILEWLASAEYVESRQRAAWHAVRRLIVDGGVRSYAVSSLGEKVARYANELTPRDYDRARLALKRLAEAAALLEAD